MPFKIWQPLEPVDAGPFQQFLQDQVVARFTTKGQRDTLLPEPFVGQLASVQEGTEVDMWGEQGMWQPVGSRIVAYGHAPTQSIGSKAEWRHLTFGGAAHTRVVRDGWAWDGGIIIREPGYYQFSVSTSGADIPGDIWMRISRDPAGGGEQVVIQNRLASLAPEGGGPNSGQAAGAVTGVQYCQVGWIIGLMMRWEQTTASGPMTVRDATFTASLMAPAPPPVLGEGVINKFG